MNTLNTFNNLVPSIKLTWTISTEQAIFLDVVIFKDPDNPPSLCTQYFKKYF